MAAEYLDADVCGGLYDLAELYQGFWTSTDVREQIALAAEIRQQEVRFGLSPVDRRRLQWEVERGNQAEERTKRRRQTRDLEKLAGMDPRELMQVVNGSAKKGSATDAKH